MRGAGTKLDSSSLGRKLVGVPVGHVARFAGRIDLRSNLEQSLWVFSVCRRKGLQGGLLQAASEINKGGASRGDQLLYFPWRQLAQTRPCARRGSVSVHDQ